MSNQNPEPKNPGDPLKGNVPDVYRATFGAIIAIILLGLYAYSVIFAIQVAQCVGTKGCTTYTAASFGDGFTQVLTLVGGLVSALVIAELAITKPGKPPGAHLLPNATPNQLSLLAGMSILYIAAWILLGLAAFFFGVVQYPKALQSLTDMGSAWLGLAVAAGYSYFGISPE